MNQSNKKQNYHVEQLMRLGAELLKLPSTASSVLAVLYHQKCINGPPLSMKTISDHTGLSVTTVSSLCTILESSGVLNRQAQFGKSGRGRKRILFSMRMNLHKFLSHCVKRHLREIERLHREMKNVEAADENAKYDEVVFSKAQVEIGLFLAEYSNFMREKDYAFLPERADREWDNIDADVEGAI